MKFLLVIALLGLSALGAQKLPTTDLIRGQIEIEQMLHQRYTNALSTVLDRSSFSLGVLVQLEALEIAAEALPASPEPEEVPDDLALGVLPMMEQAYREHRRNLQDRPIGREPASRIRSILIQVGLDPKFDKTFLPNVETWLKQRLDLEFGKRAIVEVSFVSKPPPEKAPPEPKPIPQTTPPPPPPPPPTPVPTPSPTPAAQAASRDAAGEMADKGEVKTKGDKLEKKEMAAILDLLRAFQPFAAMLLFCGTLVFVMLIWKLLSFRDKNRPLNVDVKGALNSTKPSEDGTAKVDGDRPSSLQAALGTQPENIREEIKVLCNSLCVLAKAQRPFIDVLLLVWRYDPNKKGLKKLAVFLEATGKMGENFALPEADQEEALQAFRAMASMPASEYLTVLREVYWEIQALQGLGIKALDKPFSYLARATVEQLTAALGPLSPADQSLVLLYSPPETRSAYLGKADDYMRRSILETILDKGKVGSKELAKLDEKLKSQFANPGSSEQSVALLPMLGNLVESFGPEEEIRLFKEMRDKPQVREFLRTYPNLIYIDRWPDDMLQLLVREASAEEVVGLLRLQPDLKDRTLALCPSMTAALASDELAKPDKRTPEERIHAIRQLKQRLKDLGSRLGSYLGKEEGTDDSRKAA